jgi:hypothetical protein
MIAAAYTTRAALTAETHRKGELATLWDVNASSVTLYNRLGIVAFDLGILPNQTGNGGDKFADDVSVWTMLAGGAGASISAVGNYIEFGPMTSIDEKGNRVYDKENGTPTVEGLLDLLTDYFRPNGEKVSPADRKINAAKRDAEFLGVEYKGPETSDSGSEGPETVSGTMSTEQVFLAAVRTIIQHAEDLDSETWEKYQEPLGQMSKALRAKGAFEKKQAAAAS